MKVTGQKTKRINTSTYNSNDKKKVTKKLTFIFIFFFIFYKKKYTVYILKKYRPKNNKHEKSTKE